MKTKQQRLNAYIDRNSTPQSDICKRIVQATKRHPALDAEMLSHHAVGLFLQTQARNCTYALEIGTYSGLGAAYIAQGLPDHGSVLTIERENGPALAIAKKYWKWSAIATRIQLHEGDAVQHLNNLPGDVFSLAYIDGWTSEYDSYLEAAFPVMRRGGMLVFDDMLDGDVLRPRSKNERELVRFSRKLRSDRRFSIVQVLPIGEGITVAIKK